MQTGALVIECACILVVFNRWLRYGLGFGLFGFYLGVLTTFVTFGFHFNALLVVWFLLPVDWWFGLDFKGQERYSRLWLRERSEPLGRCSRREQASSENFAFNLMLRAWHVSG